MVHTPSSFLNSPELRTNTVQNVAHVPHARLSKTKSCVCLIFSPKKGRQINLFCAKEMFACRQLAIEVWKCQQHRQPAYKRNMGGRSCNHSCSNKVNKYYKFWVRVCSLSNPVCNAHASQYSVIRALFWLYHVFKHYLTNGTISRKANVVSCPGCARSWSAGRSVKLVAFRLLRSAIPPLPCIFSQHPLAPDLLLYRTQVVFTLRKSTSVLTKTPIL